MFTDVHDKNGKVLTIKKVDTNMARDKFKDLSTTDLAEVYNQLRQRRALVEQYAKELKEAENIAKHFILLHLKAQGLKAIKLDSGSTLSTKISTKVSIGDDIKFFNWIADRVKASTHQGEVMEILSVFTKRINLTALEEVAEKFVGNIDEDHQAVVDYLESLGVKVYEEETIAVRKN